MFTGIVAEQGKVIRIKHLANLSILTLTAGDIFKGLKHGESVSVDGVCLTVAAKKGSQVSFDMMKETLAATTLGRRQPGDCVNLERAMRADSRFGGHFVTGHVDTVGILKKIVKLKNYVEFQIRISPKFMKYIVPKGSITLDGISLTVGKVKKDWFSVYLIPVTLKITTFGQRQEGEGVNVETDILARYILRQK